MMKNAFHFILKAYFVLNTVKTRDIFFIKNYAENEAGRIVPDLFLFFKKALYEVKASSLELIFNYFGSLQLGTQ